MAGRTQPTYFNAADHTVISYRDADASVERQISADLATILFEDAPPARSVPSWKGKNVYEGDYWAATTRGFVHHESFLEREYVMVADFDPSILAFSWQPFVLKWPKEVKHISSTQFAHGAEAQLPIYLKGEKAPFGIYLCIGYRDRDFEEERLGLVKSTCEAITDQGNTRLVPVFVDARPKKSASKS